jgi:Zn-dependent peptidase ImmA (M78 family)
MKQHSKKIRGIVLNLIHSPSYLSKESIEREVEKILKQMRATPQYVPKFPLDPSRVAEFLGLDIVWDTIPPDDKGRIAARIFPLNRLIEINDTIPELRGGFGASTIAHEIGHWILHINHNEVDGSSKQQILDLGLEDIQPFLCRSISVQQGIEWQAQYFAGCLLMPRSILEDIAQGRKLTSWQHLYAMAEDLGITISNLTNRLQDLGWINIPKGSKQIYPGKSTPIGQMDLLN